MLRRWAEEKWKLPWSHEAIQSQTLLELLTGFWEDYYSENTMEAKRGVDGEVYYATGDPFIDKWEEELRQGLVPDLLEGLPSVHRKAQRASHEQEDQAQLVAKQADAEFEGFSEDYSQKVSP